MKTRMWGVWGLLALAAGSALAQEAAPAASTRTGTVHGIVGQFDLPPGYALGKEEAPTTPGASGFSVHQIFVLHEGQPFALALTQQCDANVFAELDKKGLGKVGRIGLLGAATGSMDVRSTETVSIGGRSATRYMGPYKQRKDSSRIAWVIEYPHGTAQVALLYPRDSQLHEALVPAIEGMQLACSDSAPAPIAALETATP
ncbi:hypothetical protein JI752_004705 [Lysobacter sp. MMG2]|uniref:hypothetical protein n=1 Tax=Lysobacter sp. MMG2 TaxID=2801338 RepID=UPI001C2497DD|nr:hypothetical protein [Lysobacter sp. MMG2]MBU8975433.1 hypothetical protein [Lysobacter sp. MMG2]